MAVLGREDGCEIVNVRARLNDRISDVAIEMYS